MAPTVKRCAVDDYNHLTPHVSLLVAKPVMEDEDTGGVGELIEYGPHHATPEEGKSLAEMRAQEQALERHRLTGESVHTGLLPGMTIRLNDHPKDGTLKTQRLVWIEHRIDRDTYSNRIECVDAELPFRPARCAVRPKMSGLLHGIVQQGANEDEPAIDQRGRYIIRLMCDSVAGDEEKATLPIRKAQPFAGPHVGMHCPLLPRTEVLVAFENGDPDRPVIIGSVPNEVTPSPVSNKNSDRSVLRSKTGVVVQFK
jgi:type VI secretion system secreted protein VgrG